MVKLWSAKDYQEYGQIIATCAVGCARFSPEDENSLAIGTSDRKVFYFDLRNIKKPLLQFQHNRDSVLRIDFFDANTVLSQSTDGMIVSYDLKSSDTRCYIEHANVCGADDDGYVAFGGANSAVKVTTGSFGMSYLVLILVPVGECLLVLLRI